MTRWAAAPLGTDLWQEERRAWEGGARCVAGIDEAGRGALAGPVVAACVVLPFECEMPGVNDSKLLSPRQRETAFERIFAAARGIGVGAVEADQIDAVNVLRATHIAMRLALEALPGGLCPELVLIDGHPVRPFPASQLALVGGDGKSVSIAAASIIAKVTRDRLMVRYDRDHPFYGFAGHKGYGSATHLAALAQFGPCAIHRFTFRPVAVAAALRAVAK